MRILLLGKNGQVGWELQRSLAPLGNVTSVGGRGTPDGDFTQPSGLANTVRAIQPDVIVNAAAYTAVDDAEHDVETARMVNADAPALLAKLAVEFGALLVHYSSDYVFSGNGREPWREDDPTEPLNEYGRTKLAGEEAIRTSGCKHLIFRTSWVYGARGDNFAKTMLKLAQVRESLVVINDQFGVPTGADLLADISAHAIRTVVANPQLAGTYHCVPSGETTWHGYARHVIQYGRNTGLPVKVMDSDIREVASDEFPTVARRPLNSRLDTSKLRHAFDVHLPPWEAGVDRMLAEILQ